MFCLHDAIREKVPPIEMHMFIWMIIHVHACACALLWSLNYNTISLETDLDISTIMITSSQTIMDFKRDKYSPATVLNMEQVYLFVLYRGQYMELVQTVI